MHLLVSRESSPLISVLSSVFYADPPKRSMTLDQFESLKASLPWVTLGTASLSNRATVSAAFPLRRPRPSSSQSSSRIRARRGALSKAERSISPSKSSSGARRQGYRRRAGRSTLPDPWHRAITSTRRRQRHETSRALRLRVHRRWHPAPTGGATTAPSSPISPARGSSTPTTAASATIPRSRPRQPRISLPPINC